MPPCPTPAHRNPPLHRDVHSVAVQVKATGAERATAAPPGHLPNLGIKSWGISTNA